MKARGGKVIQGRRLDTSKGGSGSTLYTATPPSLEKVELITSHASGSRDDGIHVMLLDAKRPYCNALANRELFVKLPRKGPGYVEGQCMVGRLRLALYGT